MPQPIMTTWAELKGQRIGVWGVGIEGQASLLRLAAEGLTAAVVVDESPPPLTVAVPLGKGGLDGLLSCDVVLMSPGVSAYDESARSLLARGTRLTSGLELWLADADRSHVACITGTKGKSTTTTIAATLCRGLGHDALAGGNIGVPPWHPEAPRADWYFIETSSYQAHYVRSGPRVVVVTSLHQDHLTWHRGYEQYVADKLSLCTRPGVETVVVPSADTELVRNRRLLGDHVELVDEDRPDWLRSLSLVGDHNMRNALLARRALVCLGVPGARDESAVAEAARAIQPLDHRLSSIGTIGGVDFIDDSLSTNSLATVAALRSMTKDKISLLVGGQDRGIDYDLLADALVEEGGRVCVFGLPENGSRITRTIRQRAPEVQAHDMADLRSAMRAAYEWARPLGSVLLSPAAPSFGHFRDYQDRSRAFAAEMNRLLDTHRSGHPLR